MRDNEVVLISQNYTVPYWMAAGTCCWPMVSHSGGVEVIPARLPLEPTELDWRIIHHTLAIIEADDCYRSWASGLPPQLQEMVADLRIVDCGTFGGLTLPRLKVLSSRIRERDPTLKMLSTQQVADTLSKFGVRIPVPRPRGATV
jgi:hypothetical protein